MKYNPLELFISPPFPLRKIAHISCPLSDKASHFSYKAHNFSDKAHNFPDKGHNFSHN